NVELLLELHGRAWRRVFYPSVVVFDQELGVRIELLPAECRRPRAAEHEAEPEPVRRYRAERLGCRGLPGPQRIGTVQRRHVQAECDKADHDPAANDRQDRPPGDFDWEIEFDGLFAERVGY